MLIRNVLAEAFETKCYLLATGRGSECVIVDPGLGVSRRLAEAVAEHGLRPVAVLLTHGHLDHTASVAEVCATYGVPAHINPADNWMFSDPMSGLGAEFGPQFEQVLGPRWTWREPEVVRPLRDGDVLELAGLRLGVTHTPGHTPGSSMFEIRPERSPHAYCLVGDVLHSGSIGRTDMPGGSRVQTLTSLKGVLAKPDETILLTGHGENSTVGVERIVNPFMRQAAAWEPPKAP